MDNKNLIYMAFDADNAGRKVGRAILDNAPDELKSVSQKIQLGNEVVDKWAKEHGGICYSSGGDQGLYALPAEAESEIEHIRKDYEFTTGLTLTIGIGKDISEAGRALLAGKIRGKNVIVKYDETVDKDLSTTHEKVKQGEGSEEEKKLDESYIDHENKTDDKKSDQKDKEELKDMHKDDKKNQKGLEPKEETNENRKVEEKQQDKNIHDKDQEDHGGEAAEQVAEQISEQDSEPNESDPKEDANLASGKEMENGVSRPEDYDQQNPGDMGLAEDGEDEENKENEDPNLEDVLRNGLDEYAHGIKKDKVIQMVSQALEGFKAQKDILERAKEKAPELYSSCINMLRAMIEMSKMLELNQDPEQNDQQQEPGQEPEQDQNQEQPQGKPQDQGHEDDQEHEEPEHDENISEAPSKEKPEEKKPSEKDKPSFGNKPKEKDSKETKKPDEKGKEEDKKKKPAAAQGDAAPFPKK